jgi:transposase-like protein
MKTPQTLQQAVIYFADADRAFQYALDLRFPNGVVACPRCGSEKHSFIKTRRIWFCAGCKKQFSLKVGTIFEDSPITLDKWMMAIWMLTNCKNGVSSYELGRSIGVRQQSAWFMLHRIREAMKSGSFAKIDPKDGPVEIDEAWVGGKPKNMHKDRRIKYNQGENKAIVLGMKSRSTREVRAMVVPNVKRETLQAQILQNVGFGANIHTDGWPGYDHLGAKGRFVHEIVNHMQEYVHGEVHTNGIENFWSCLKRTLRGTYVAVEPFHMDSYLSEQVFRFNNSVKSSDSKRFEKVMGQVAGKRLTYATLTGAGSATSH